MEFDSSFFKKYSRLKTFVILLVVGIMLIIVSSIFIVKPNTNKVKVDAVINEINEYTIGSETSYQVIVSYYDLNGNFHERVPLNGYSSTMKKGKTIKIQYKIGREDEPLMDATIVPYIFLGIGIALLLISIIVPLILIFKHKDGYNELNNVHLQEVNESELDEIENSKEIQCEFYFHYYGKLNQSFILETPKRTPMYKGECQKIGFFKSSKFNFQNCDNDKFRICQVTKTVTIRTNEVLQKSYFKIDGVNCYDYLSKLGYSIENELNGLKMNFKLYHYGIEVGYIESAGVNIIDDNKQYIIGDVIPGRGLYKVYCRPSDIEGAFFACFIMSMVDII